MPVIHINIPEVTLISLKQNPEAFEAAKKAGRCRLVGFTGRRDPHVHLAMLRSYDRYDTMCSRAHRDSHIRP